MAMNQVSGQGTTFPAKPESREIPYRREPWYAAYMAALFEADRKQIRSRINYAEQLMVTRERELMSQSNDFSEQRALNNALHALRALWSCLNL
jgi:hypothetical protein